MISKQFSLGLVSAIFLIFAAAAQAQDKPNMLIIWGDDIGQSVYRTGLSKVGLPGTEWPASMI
jgi:hypothetical protein